MNVNRVIQSLANAFDDLPGLKISDRGRRYCMSEAVREYSRYKPLLRRFGIGGIYDKAVAGSTSVLLVGGPFYANATVTLGQYTPWAEIVTISSIGPPEDDIPWFVGSPVLATLNSPTVNTHNAGEYAGNAVIGLTLSAGVDGYLMPYDFIEPDADSFDIAVGARSSYRKYEGFYDFAYTETRNYSGAGIGAQQNYGVGGFAYLQGPNPNAVSVSTTQNSTGETVYRFVESEPQLMTILPAPAHSGNLDFHYNAMHMVATVPDTALGALLWYARFAACKSKELGFAMRLDFSEDDIHETPSSNAKTLNTTADSCLNEWKRLVANRPRIVSG